MFTKLMLGDYEIGVFEQKWEEIVGNFGVEYRKWIIDMYGRRNMWATAHIRETFFAGFRRTLRCESLHAVLKGYVKSRHNLTEFIQHFQCCLSYMRHRQNLANFKSSNRQPIMKTHFQQLERHCRGTKIRPQGSISIVAAYCRKGGHNITTCSMRKMDEKTPQFDCDGEKNRESEDYSFVGAESDEYVHTEWFDDEDVQNREI
ncbi:hypothetical protein Ahy_B08g090511 [Arachis hypogaea]|uniref:Protein FAR1-RELATED SEQUENCE n=1 Tax=Arachis hypogaea TaxID=3818 RepID=A0A444Y0B8_ARAHY|nr:hypothetical protein Ahy_B08g090511 [Arachis hypogaea]